ncbi:GTP-binding protein [Pseudomonas sp. 2FE]|uniref:CobW family GTP-binding protein n=1 Tax=Pseudomonas sp. 2FE TaxID=2502190 RepID=UPI0010F6E754|nr:GTP-binding protein [Pseudomonas sp. 2FE]
MTTALPPIPVTLLTGFLGAGKTTLLNRLLSAPHGLRIAVIENEFGPVNIDSALLVRETAEVIEMTNGCLCCTIRGDLVGHLQALQRRRAAGELAFDRLVIETTGLADPTPLVQTFFGEPTLLEAYQLDGILTLVDALHAGQQLDRHPLLRKQIGFADRLLISKADLVSSAALAALGERLAAMNPLAPQLVLRPGELPLAQLFELRGFHLDAAAPGPALAAATGRFQPLGRSFADDIAALHWQHQGWVDRQRVGAVVQGVLAVRDDPCRLIFQGVHRIAGFDYGQAWAADEAARCDIVLIGRQLPTARLQAELTACAVI